MNWDLHKYVADEEIKSEELKALLRVNLTIEVTDISHFNDGKTHIKVVIKYDDEFITEGSTTL